MMISNAALEHTSLYDPYSVEIQENAQLGSGLGWAQMRCNYLFVDKTELISNLEHCRKGIIARPRGWGKTLNLEMLRLFFGCPIRANGSINKPQQHLNRALFIGDQENQKYLSQLTSDEQSEYLQQRGKLIQNKQIKLQPLKIAQNKAFCDKHFSRYIVVHMSFDFIREENEGEANFQRQILKQIKRFYYEHRDYLFEKQSSLYKQYQDINEQNQPYCPTNILSQLLWHLEQFHEKNIMLLIDQFDAPYRSYFEAQTSKQKKIFANYLSTIAYSFKEFIQGLQNNHTYKLIAMGRDMMNASKYQDRGFLIEVTDNSPYLYNDFGFTQKQISEQLVSKIFKNETQIGKNVHKSIMKVISRLYNGYSIRKSRHDELAEGLYNPYSVTRYLQRCIQEKRILDMDETTDQSLCFWNQKAQNKVILNYLILNLIENCQNFDKKLQLDLILFNAIFYPNEKRAFRSIKQDSQWLRRKLYVQQQDLKFSQIYYLANYMVEMGYLVLDSNKQLKIPNEQIQRFFDKVLRSYIEQLMLTQMSQLKINKQLEINQWRHVLQEIVDKITKKTNYYNLKFINALTATYIKHIFKQSYTLVQEKLMRNMQSLFIYTPKHSCDPIILHYQIILHSDAAQWLNKLRLQQSFFKILYENWFQITMQSQQYIKTNWNTMILRQVIGIIENFHQFYLQINQRVYTKKDIETFSCYSQLLFEYERVKSVQCLDQALLIYFQHTLENKMTALTILDIIKEKHNGQIFKKNTRFLQNFKQVWQNDQYTSKISQKRPSQDETSTYYLKFINFMKLRYFASSCLIQNENQQGLLHIIQQCYYTHCMKLIPLQNLKQMITGALSCTRSKSQQKNVQEERKLKENDVRKYSKGN